MKKRLGGFRRREDGTATLEFAIMFPMFVFMLLSGVEIGMINFRHSLLERGLDMAVRDLRIGPTFAPSHGELKESVCTYAGFLPNCTNSLKLEMVQVDMRNYTSMPGDSDCTDKADEVSPVRNFKAGGANTTMVLRACFKFDPVFPLSGLGKDLATQDGGQAAMIATTAYVQEPR
ncbi:TadE/TadG family type IV pilus assembly protein [Litorivita pollutaquae]|uniref:TadE/TadG family type IV pilus assembly protein n=1 Tax=Litorivita pollutaquae TaxID=2200892 RepID=UPI001F27E1AE|nr:TadE family protein [Litorivita pollutaquae]